MDGLEVEQSNYNSGVVKNVSNSQIQLNSLENSQLNLSSVLGGGENCHNESIESVDCNDPKQYLFAKFNKDSRVESNSKPIDPHDDSKWDSPSSEIVKKVSAQTN